MQRVSNAKIETQDPDCPADHASLMGFNKFHVYNYGSTSIFPLQNIVKVSQSDCNLTVQSLRGSTKCFVSILVCMSFWQNSHFEVLKNFLLNQIPEICKSVSVIFYRIQLWADLQCRRECTRWCSIIDKYMNGFKHMNCPCLVLFEHRKLEKLLGFWWSRSPIRRTFKSSHLSSFVFLAKFCNVKVDWSAPSITVE